MAACVSAYSRFVKEERQLMAAGGSVLTEPELRAEFRHILPSSPLAYSSK
jgi:hypothetical protein